MTCVAGCVEVDSEKRVGVFGFGNVDVPAGTDIYRLKRLLPLRWNDEIELNL
jgi:hypothetical protein